MNTWGNQFDLLRHTAYLPAAEPAAVYRYVLQRAFGFCEACGTPGSTLGDYPQMSVHVLAENIVPWGALCLCPACQTLAAGNGDRLLVKAKWIEDNLAKEVLLYVTAAVILHQDSVFICQKPHSELWEFPGGKLDEGESLALGLQREIREELNLSIEVTDPLGLVDHDYGIVKLRLFGLLCRVEDLNNLRLKEHLDSRWCPLNELKNVNFSEADVEMAAKLEQRTRALFLVPGSLWNGERLR